MASEGNENETMEAERQSACPVCGSRLSQAAKFCPSCGAYVKYFRDSVE